MAGNINEAGIFTRDSNQALLADVQYLEPYGSSALNRKMLGIILPGIFRGYNCTPGTGLKVKVSSTNDGTGAACVEVNGYQITVQQLKDVEVSIPAGRTSIILLEANYGQGTLTKQVSSGAALDAARFVVVARGAAIAPNQIEICRVNVPQGVTGITQSMIDTSFRTQRRVGPIISDALDSTSQYDVASSNAIRLALAASKVELDKKIAIGQQGLATDRLTLISNFDWQNYVFKGGEYLYIDWATAKNNPDIDYPNDYYQIMVIGLNDGTNQTLLIRPTNYVQPLAPFMISWTGAAGSRAFKTRALMTNFENLTALNIGPNDLTRRCHVGIFGQPANAGAVISMGYPIPEAGSLRVEASAYGYVQQEYIAFMSGSRFTRAMTPSVDATKMIWSKWVETPTTNKYTFWEHGNVLGIEAGEQNRVYLDNRDYSINAIVGGIRSEWYTHSTYAGLRRGGTTDMLGYSIEVDGTERLRLKDYALEVYSNHVGVFDDAPAYCFYNKAGTQVGNIQYKNADATMTFWNVDGSNMVLASGMLYFGEVVKGADHALIRGVVEGGIWSEWGNRAAGLMIDMSVPETAYSIWKATEWGQEHVAAMSVVRSLPTNVQYSSQVRIHIEGADYQFSANGQFISPGGVFAAGGSTEMSQNAVYIRGTGNKHLWFYSPSGEEIGLVYASDDKVLHLRAAGGPSADISANGNMTLAGVDSSFRAPLGLDILGNLHTNGSASASPVLLRAWGMPAGDRKTVFEVSDNTSWLYYCQRVANGTINLAINGDVQAGTANFSTVVATNNINANYFYTEGIRGAGAFVDQLGSGAPFYANCGQRPVADNSYFPLVKGHVQLDNGYPTAASFGLLTGGSTFASAIINVMGDNGNNSILSYDVHGLLSGVTTLNVQTVQASSVINCGDTDSGLYANGDGNVAFRANGVHVGQINQSELRTSAQIVATTSVYAGGGTAQFGTNGDIYGSVWGNNWLSTWISGNFGTQAWVNQRISDVQTWAGGVLVSNMRWTAEGGTNNSNQDYTYATAPHGAAITGVLMKGDYLAVTFRYLQMYTNNGGWVTLGYS